MTDIRQRIVADGDQVHNVWEQPSRDAILERNRAVRDNPTAPPMDWAAPHLRIPELDLYLLKQQQPDLASPDGQIRRKAWIAFYNSPESLPYRVRPRAGGATNRVYLGGRQ
jgi:hypothetical protein